MKVPLSWLREFVDVDLSPEAVAERLTLLGLEVKGLAQVGAEWQHVVVGELLEVRPHPRADRLSLARVRVGAANAGGDEVLDIVCGATNIAAGQRVPVALPGAVLPGDRRIERTEKMGVVSNGMLCSGDELRLTGDAEGILILSPETPVGARLADRFGDTVLDVDVKPNRGDALSIVGIAREIAAVTNQVVRWPATDVEERGAPIEEHLRARVEDERLCPRFVGRWLSGVRIGPSPDGVQMRLIAAGQRPVSNVVDASNYVMLELGKPIHTFDAAAVGEGTIVVRRARPGERLVTLDHVDRALTDDPLEVRSALRQALAGAGLVEVVTFALVSAGDVERYAWSVASPPAAGESAREGDPIAVTNPLSQDHAFLRRTIVGSLAGIVDGNARRGIEDVAIFEVGKGYGRVGEEPREWWRLGIALSGAFEPGAWNRPARAADVDDAKGLAELVARIVGAGQPVYATLTDDPLLHPGRSATV
ncbi:MAG TPA: phenylalanine--tRNA ligase subunit beta, partial [Candidatus Binatus sp.]|nr:phenylalanine--tRNA ligase subunit beta [Candidatus Binatus sp.]